LPSSSGQLKGRPVTVGPDELVELLADRGEPVMIGVGVRCGVVGSDAASLDNDCPTSGAEVVATSELMLVDKTALADRSTLMTLAAYYVDEEALLLTSYCLGS
jgi:hypothetical protein